MDRFPKLTLVTGGASSGKSRLAERLVRASGRRRVYVATAQAFDDEMRARIARHQRDRGAGWRTIEAPLDLWRVLGQAQADEVWLVDCLTLWLSNHLLAENDVERESARLLETLGGIAAPVVLVSNEVGMSVVPDNPLARRFQSAQGRLNQQVGEMAELALAVMAGFPVVLKGRLPEALT